MHRNEGLSYMVNQSQAFDAMMEILHSGKKVVFNPNLLNYEGASRYARSIGGKLAPVVDYDKDGMPDFLIYNKSGKIVVINGMRLKDNHKMQLKRIFYQAFPDKSKRKLMGGFQGFLNTVLFQVGPYNFQGVRQVNVPKKSMELLEKLYKLGYLKKEPIKYLPKTNKGVAQTFRTSIMLALRQGLNQAFPNKTKLTNYLPLTTIRDFLYNIIIMPRIMDAAKKDGEFERIKGMLAGYYSRKGQAANSLKKEFSLFSQYLSNNENLQEQLMTEIDDILILVFIFVISELKYNLTSSIILVSSSFNSSNLWLWSSSDSCLLFLV